MLGGMLGTATNSKMVGGLSGAALGAGGSALAAAMGLGAAGGPIGIAIGAIVGGIMGALGTTKASVGPNAAGNLYVNGGGAKSGPSDGDNGMDGSAMRSLTDGLAQSINTIVSGIGATFKSGLAEMNFGHVTFNQKDNKYTYTPMAGAGQAGGKQDFTDQAELVTAIIRDTLKRLDAGGQVTGVNADTRTALTNSKAKTAEDLATDLSYASGFRQQLNAMTAALNPTNYQLGEMTKSAKELGDKVKTNIVDWAAKAKELGLATDAELLPALQNGLTAMLGLGPVVQPLRGLDAVTKQAQINFETLKPSLEAAGFTAAQQADLQAQYIAKARQDYLDGVNLVQSQGDTAIAALLDPAARLSAVTRMAANGFDMAIPGMSGLGQTIDRVELAARAGTLTTGDLKFALGQIDEQWRAGALTAEQYNASIQTITTGWQTSMGVINAMRQGDWAVTSAIDPTRKPDAGGILADAGIVSTAAGVAGFTAQLGAFLTTARAGQATAEDLTYTHGQLKQLLASGAITTQQYQTVVTSLTGAYTDATAAATTHTDALATMAATIRRGAASVAAVVDPTRKPDASAILADAGLNGASAGLAGFTTQLDAFLATARSGKATAADLTYTYGVLERLLTAGVITGEQYSTVLTGITSAWTDGKDAATTTAAAFTTLADTIRRGSASVAAVVDPTRRPDASAILADAGLNGASAGLAGFTTQLDAFLATARSGKATAADLTYTYGVLERLLTAGVITGEQYSTVLTGITSAWTDGKDAATTTAAAFTTLADTIRRGSASVAAVVDPTRRPDASAILADAGLNGASAGLAGFTTQLDAFLATARSGKATAADLTYTYGVLERLLTAGVITGEQYSTVLTGITSAWTDGKDAATTTGSRVSDGADRVWSATLTKAASEIGDGWRAAANAARQAAADWTGVGTSMQRALDGLLVNKDLSNLGAKAMLDTTEVQFTTAARTVMDYQSKLQLGVTPSEEARQAAVDAAGQLDTLGQRYLEEARAYGLGAEEYQRRLEQVQGLWSSTRDMARSLATAETSRAQGLDRQIDWLSKLNDTMSGTAGTNARLLEDIKGAILAGRTPTQTTDSRAGAWMTDWFQRYNTLLGDQASGRLSADQVTVAGTSLYNEKLAQVDALPSDAAVWRQVIDAARAAANGTATADWLAQIAHQKSVPGFATGGHHVGGARIVGERGAELEVTGPARYWTHDQTRDILSPKMVNVTLDLVPVVTAIGGVTSAVMDIGRLIQDLAGRVANVEEAIADLSRSQDQLAVQIRKVASK